MTGESNEGRLAEIGERTEALSRVVWHQQPAQVLHLLHHDIPFLLAEVSVLQERVRVLTKSAWQAGWNHHMSALHYVDREGFQGASFDDCLDPDCIAVRGLL